MNYDDSKGKEEELDIADPIDIPESELLDEEDESPDFEDAESEERDF